MKGLTLSKMTQMVTKNIMENSDHRKVGKTWNPVEEEEVRERECVCVCVCACVYVRVLDTHSGG